MNYRKIPLIALSCIALNANIKGADALPQEQINVAQATAVLHNHVFPERPIREGYALHFENLQRHFGLLADTRKKAYIPSLKVMYARAGLSFLPSDFRN